MAILYGTQSNGETLPVLVDQFGNLLAKGIEGPPGPPGPPGVGELPPGATDGALLGWQDGELVWITEPVPPVYVDGFIPIIWTGNGVSQSINCGFSPDLVWIKEVNSGGDHHLFDIVRGATKSLRANVSDGETIDSNELTAFTSDGFNLGSGSDVNESGKKTIAWCWDAGDTTVTNNDGSIESQVRSNGSFSVVKYTGLGGTQTFGHGLNSPADFIIIKQINDISYWLVGHKNIFNEDGYMRLNEPTSLELGSGAIWQSKAPTSTTVSIGNSSINTENTEYITYCWAQKPGVSSFGDYLGNGSRNTITTGFRPSLVIIKSTSSGNWYMFDNARGASNALYANEFTGEQDTGSIEFLDNGFQLLFGLPGVNQSNDTYIYGAFANPEDAAFAQRQLRRQERQEKRQQNETPLR